ncbi:MAG: UDP-N-acetylglucosamine 1-carboxyvinyltransferase 1 [Elusimicrobia bacterium ADurb.Bin231]|nr:MAG: UDP-N-acetylglucosamine 1-carboxyvinyltransferase 1 [Elusimicrobia bacterium ADurb.Bin231]
MEKMLIKGGKRLKGCVNISGSKNSALPILIATLLTDDNCVIKNVPVLQDIMIVVKLLKHLGKKIKFHNHEITVSQSGGLITEAPYELVKKMRASILVMGPLLARYKKAKVSMPGGCEIGLRPIDIHLDGFKKMGAVCDIFHGDIKIKTSGLIGSRIVLDFPSVGATENLLMAAALSQGETIIENAAIEPEIADLSDFLVEMGACISGIGTRKLIIKGVKKLSGCSYSVMPDRIESGTFMIAAAITGGDIKICGTIPEHNDFLTEKLKVSGCELKNCSGVINIKRTGKIFPVNIETSVYPGFPTDLQNMWMALMTISAGESLIVETIFENRFKTIAEFSRMGADIKVKGNCAIVKGVNSLKGAEVCASDLRSSAALVLAGLCSAGETSVSGLGYLDRGYENFEHKLKKLGASIKRIEG